MFTHGMNFQKGEEVPVVFLESPLLFWRCQQYKTKDGAAQ